jgi:hypothetical protein
MNRAGASAAGARAAGAARTSSPASATPRPAPSPATVPAPGARPPKEARRPGRNCGKPVDRRRIPDCRIDPDKMLRQKEMAGHWTNRCGPGPAAASTGLTSRRTESILARPTVRGQWCSPRTPGCSAGGHVLLDTLGVDSLTLPARPAGTRASRDRHQETFAHRTGKGVGSPDEILRYPRFRIVPSRERGCARGTSVPNRRPHAVSFHVTPVGGNA